MRILTEQLERSLDSGLYYLSLFTALTIPDIAGALDSDDGEANGDRYREWFEKWVRPRFAEQALAQVPRHARPYVRNLENPLTGDACYRFRCSLLHQGSSQHPQSPYARVIFIEPGATSDVVHCCPINDALAIDLRRFCAEVISGTHLWLQQVESTDRYKANYERFAKRHPTGLPPYIKGFQ